MPTPEFTSIKMPASVLEMTVGNRRLGVLIDEVKELIQPAFVSHVPKTHPFTKGVFRLRDHIYPLIDLPVLFHQTDDYTGEEKDEWKYVLIQHIGHVAGLFVHAIHDIVTVNEDDILCDDLLTEEEAVVAFGYVQNAGEKLLLINIPHLVQYIKSLNQEVV